MKLDLKPIKEKTESFANKYTSKQDETDIKELGLLLLNFLMLSTIMVNLGILIFASVYDFGFMSMYDVADKIDNAGLLQNGFLGILGDIISSSTIVLTSIDMIWLFSFVSVVVLMFYASYKMRRENIFGTLFYIFYGIMVFIFLLNIVLQVTNWFNDYLLNGVLKGVAESLPFYTYYIQNAGTISVIVLAICIVLNFVDFDTLGYNLRKQEERKLNDEL